MGRLFGPFDDIVAVGRARARVAKDQGAPVLAHVARGRRRRRGGTHRHGDRKLGRKCLFTTEHPGLHTAGPQWLFHTKLHEHDRGGFVDNTRGLNDDNGPKREYFVDFVTPDVAVDVGFCPGAARSHAGVERYVDELALYSRNWSLEHRLGLPVHSRACVRTCISNLRVCIRRDSGNEPRCHQQEIEVQAPATCLWKVKVTGIG
jgi:hypothetical protein